MRKSIDLDELVTRFILASRELYNNFFRVCDPYANDGWSAERRYAEVEGLLFQKMVIEVAALNQVPYGEPNDGLLVEGRNSQPVPAVVNRDIDGGYWDFPVTELTADSVLTFVKLFDWDQLTCRDNQYVRVLIAKWPSCERAVGKHALIERRHIRFVRPIKGI